MNENGEFTVNIEIIITTVRYDYYVYRLLNMYLLTNYTNDRRSKATRYKDEILVACFVIMLDKSIRRNKTCCRRKVLVVLLFACRLPHAKTNR